MEQAEFTDPRDGQVYKTIKIGKQVWVAENLRFETLKGSWLFFETPKGSWFYNNDSVNYKIYGRLYNWEVALQAVPPGWHLPSYWEWLELIEYLGGKTLAGGKMKETGTKHWLSPNTGATNESGFTALPAGYRSKDGEFHGLGKVTDFWSNTVDWRNNPISFALRSHTPEVAQGNYLPDSYEYKQYGSSIRCIKDSGN